MKKFDAGWVTGMIEGEGCFDFLANRNYPQRYIRLRVGSTDLDVVERLREILGAGTIHEQKSPAGKAWKTYWRLTVHGAAVERLIAEIYPHLSVRRKKVVDELLEAKALRWAS